MSHNSSEPVPHTPTNDGAAFAFVISILGFFLVLSIFSIPMWYESDYTWARYSYPYHNNMNSRPVKVQPAAATAAFKTAEVTAVPSETNSCPNLSNLTASQDA